MPPRLVTVATFPNALEAGVARDRLLTEGIAACLANDEVVGMMWHLSNAVGGVKVQVYEDDAERARGLLEQPRAASSRTPSWKCPKCARTIEGEFQICWACGTSRDGVEDPQFDTADVEPEEAAVHTPAKPADTQTGEVPTSFLDRKDDGNPFRSPLAEGETAATPDEALMHAADELARRAWKSAIVGLFACPPLLHFYSIYLLLKIGGASDSLSRTGSRHYYGALLVDALALIAVGISLKSLR